jgi:hypothetical protein
LFHPANAMQHNPDFSPIRFPRLVHATAEQRQKCELSVNGIRWDDIDEDISVAGLLAGRGDSTRATKAAA